VDVFVTACGEPLAMVERTLMAAVALEGEHRTYLLDDGNDLACAQLCERIGAHYLTRSAKTGAKAGNVNAALPRTSGEVVVIFDIDHVPRPDFLSQTLHHFADPRVGFVQVMLTFSNSDESWVSRAASEASLDFYNPTSMGMDALHSVTLMGSNALIRRTALDMIGGYQFGLAEDLATSLALHAAGWRSIYIARPLAPGLAPASLQAWNTQQLKWARGVFEVLLTAFPRAFTRLGWSERLAYIVRMTKYWIGPAVFLHLAIPAGALLFASALTRAAVQDYLLHLAPLVVCDLLIRREAIRLWRHPSAPAIIPVRGIALIYTTWPIYTWAWILALLRIPVGFRPTPKARSGQVNPLWLLPQTITCLLLVSGCLVSLRNTNVDPCYFLLSFVVFQVAFQLWPIGSWISWRKIQGRLPGNDKSGWGEVADV
jgi:cellulose synthase/poly-beta-1,6-N-acetylglucosamine synthase-like glycosyltransferase